MCNLQWDGIHNGEEREKRDDAFDTEGGQRGLI